MTFYHKLQQLLLLPFALELVLLTFVKVLNIRSTKRNDTKSTAGLAAEPYLYFCLSFTIPRGQLLFQIKVCIVILTRMPQAATEYY